MLLSAVLWTLLPTLPVAAALSDGALPLPQFPAGAIRDVPMADLALRAARAASVEQAQQFVARREACYGKLIAEPCLREAIEDNVRAERRIREVEVEARGFKRQRTERAAREAREARRAREAADAPGKQAEAARVAAVRKEQAELNAKLMREGDAQAGERAARAAREQRRQAERLALRQRKDAEEAARASERREHARAHEAKVQEVLRRAQEKDARARENAARTAAGKT